jgi:hypothetical protein
MYRINNWLDKVFNAQGPLAAIFMALMIYGTIGTIIFFGFITIGVSFGKLGALFVFYILSLLICARIVYNQYKLDK